MYVFIVMIVSFFTVAVSSWWLGEWDEPTAELRTDRHDLSESAQTQPTPRLEGSASAHERLAQKTILGA